MSRHSTAIFSDAPVPKAVLVNAIPAIVSMIMVLIYNLADTFFIGKTGVGEMVTAVSLVTPSFLIFMAFGMIFGIGGTSLISRKLGEGNTDQVKKIASFCFWTGLAVGIVSMVIVIVFINPLCSLIGAREDSSSLATINYTKSYFSIVSISLPFLIVSGAFSNIIRAEGKATVAMVGNIVGNLVNVVLDPIMILGFGWGIQGAAIATVIGNIVAMIFYTIHLVSKRSIFSINPKYYSAKKGIMSNVLLIGVPASLNSILMSVSNIIVNNFMMEFGDNAVGGLGIAFKVNMITVMLLIGLGTGIQPLLGYCYGAKNYKRFASVIKFSVILAFGMSVVMSLITYFAATPLVKGFISVSEQVSYGTSFVKILVVSGPILGVLFVMVNALQGMGAAGPSLMLSASRQGIIYLPILFLIHLSAQSANMLVWAQPISDYLSTALAVMLFIITFKKFKKSVLKCEAENKQQEEDQITEVQ